MNYLYYVTQILILNNLVSAHTDHSSDESNIDMKEELPLEDIYLRVIPNDDEDKTPRMLPLKGGAYPLPRIEKKEELVYVVRKTLKVKITRNVAEFDLLWNVTELFLQKFAALMTRSNFGAIAEKRLNYAGRIKLLVIRIEACCTSMPHSKMYEAYKLRVERFILVEADRIWGVIRALDTLIQLFYIDDDGLLVINGNTIEDAPKFSHRGLMLDTATQYVPVDNILKMLDAMAMDKMNILHWRIVGYASFPYQSNVLPELSDIRAIESDMVYNETSIKRIVEFAAIRGIRVIPEFNIPEIVTRCFPGSPTGPLDPAEARIFELIKLLITEVQERFPDDHIHLGGDNVNEEYWASNPGVRHYINNHGIRINMNLVFLKYLIDEVLKPGTTLIVAQNALDHSMVDEIFPKNTIAQAYSEDLFKKMFNYNHHTVILSFLCDVTDRLNMSFVSMYEKAEDLMIKSPLSQHIGAEALIYKQIVDENNMFRVWPESSALADALWHGFDQNNDFRNETTMNHLNRLVQEHLTRMVVLGIPLA